MKIEKLGIGKWTVESSKGDKFYNVKFAQEIWTCDCPAFAYRYAGNGCKHIEAVKAQMGESENPKPICLSKVRWVTEKEDMTHVPIVPFGWDWTTDYIAILIYDLFKLGYSSEQIKNYSLWKEFLEANGKKGIIDYCEQNLNLEERRKYIDKEWKHLESGGEL